MSSAVVVLFACHFPNCHIFIISQKKRSTSRLLCQNGVKETKTGVLWNVLKRIFFSPLKAKSYKGKSTVTKKEAFFLAVRQSKSPIFVRRGFLANQTITKVRGSLKLIFCLPWAEPWWVVNEVLRLKGTPWDPYAKNPGFHYVAVWPLVELL